VNENRANPTSRTPFEAYKAALAGRGADLFDDLATWARVGKDSIGKALERGADPDALGYALFEVGLGEREVHDLGRTDQRLGALHRAEGKLRAAQERLTQLLAGRTGPGNTRAIATFFHCGLCIAELPRGVSPREFMRLEIGFTPQGIQVWCVRHDCNVMHVDFEGQKHPANTTRRKRDGE